MTLQRHQTPISDSVDHETKERRGGGGGGGGGGEQEHQQIRGGGGRKENKNISKYEEEEEEEENKLNKYEKEEEEENKNINREEKEEEENKNNNKNSNQRRIKATRGVKNEECRGPMHANEETRQQVDLGDRCARREEGGSARLKTSGGKVTGMKNRQQQGVGAAWVRAHDVSRGYIDWAGPVGGAVGGARAAHRPHVPLPLVPCQNDEGSRAICPLIGQVAVPSRPWHRPLTMGVPGRLTNHCGGHSVTGRGGKGRRAAAGRRKGGKRHTLLFSVATYTKEEFRL
ncbi:hypothetical protein O3P69_010561 [Scylla paramamosain]|uniref:Uncharacterized protein n=1 Tax=Scylla paramamosain TaxID=85552 RepID=A0AAW0TEZ5_SCYPA